jgi:hypothetical protein
MTPEKASQKIFADTENKKAAALDALDEYLSKSFEFPKDMTFDDGVSVLSVDTQQLDAVIEEIKNTPVNQFHEFNGKNIIDVPEFERFHVLRYGTLVVNDDSQILADFKVANKVEAWSVKHFVIFVEKLVFVTPDKSVRLGCTNFLYTPHEPFGPPRKAKAGKRGSGHHGQAKAENGEKGGRPFGGNFGMYQHRWPPREHISYVDTPNLWLFVNEVEVQGPVNNTPFFIFEQRGCDGGDAQDGGEGGDGGAGARGKKGKDWIGTCHIGPGDGGDGGDGYFGGRGGRGGHGGRGGDVNIIGKNAAVDEVIKSIFFTEGGVAGMPGKGAPGGKGGARGEGGGPTIFCGRGNPGVPGRDGNHGIDGDLGIDGASGNKATMYVNDINDLLT